MQIAVIASSLRSTASSLAGRAVSLLHSGRSLLIRRPWFVSLV